MKCLHYAINERRQGHSGNSKGCCVCVGEKKKPLQRRSVSPHCS